MNIIAHRGANRKAPQNTLPAFRIAYNENADGFETDVHMTKDGELVLCHNYSVDATSNGKGEISDYTLAELKKLDFGEYFANYYFETEIPTLREFLSFVASTDITVLNLELKTPHNGEEGLVEKTLELVKEFGLTEKLILSSFDRRLLVRAKEIDPEVKTAYLFATDEKIGEQRMIPSPKDIFDVKVDYIHPITCLVTKAMVCYMHRHGVRVNVWTVNHPAEIRRLKFCGVDGIITDMPLETRKVTDR